MSTDGLSPLTGADAIQANQHALNLQAAERQALDRQREVAENARAAAEQNTVRARRDAGRAVELTEQKEAVQSAADQVRDARAEQAASLTRLTPEQERIQRQNQQFERDRELLLYQEEEALAQRDAVERQNLHIADDRLAIEQAAAERARQAAAEQPSGQTTPQRQAETTNALQQPTPAQVARDDQRIVLRQTAETAAAATAQNQAAAQNRPLQRGDLSPPQNPGVENAPESVVDEEEEEDVKPAYASAEAENAEEFREVDTRWLERDFFDNDAQNSKGTPVSVIADLYAARSNLLREVERLDSLIKRLQ